jgi:hypothetical protein
LFQIGKSCATPRLFSYPSAPLGTREWQTKELRDTENERVRKNDMQKELQAHTLQYKAEGAYDLQRKELQGRFFGKGGGSEASERLKRGEWPFETQGKRVGASDSNKMIA